MKNLLRLVFISNTLFSNFTQAQILIDKKIDTTNISIYKNDKLVSIGQAVPTVTAALQQSSDVYVRSYGIGGAGTVAYRGLGGAQTTILWNGIPINSPILGQADANQWMIAPGATVRLAKPDAKQTGTQANPGNVEIDNPFVATDTLQGEIRAVAGSFGRYGGQALLQSKLSSRWQAYTGITASQAANNFRIKRTSADYPELPNRQQNAAIEQQTATVGVRAGWSKTVLQIHTLLAGASRQLPLHLDAYHTKERLATQDVALSTTLRSRFGRILLDGAAGCILDNARYTYPSGLQTSKYGYVSVPVSTSLMLPFADSAWAAGLTNNYRIDKAQGEDYKAAKPLQTYAGTFFIDGYYGVLHRAGMGFFAFRNQILPTYQLILGSIRPQLWQLSIRSLQRSPTINDLYYPQYGNPNLKAEHGFGVEASLLLAKKHRSNHSFSANIQPFYYGYASYLRWLPTTSIYRPESINKVVSRGATLQIAYAQSLGKHIAITTRYEVTYAQTGRIDGNWVGEPVQFIYSPHIKQVFTLESTIHKWGFTARGAYTSSRAISGDGSQALPAFFLVDGMVSYTHQIAHSHTIKIDVSIQNATASTYQWVANYATPGVGLTAGASYKF